MKLFFVLATLLNFTLSDSFAYDWSDTKKIINNAIEDKTLPGAVLIVGDRTDILFHQSFGTRDLINPNSTKTLYDLASLTKIVVTTTSIMILEEQGKLSIKNKVSTLYPDFTGNGKENVTIEQLLRHESGLSAWLKPLESESLESFIQRFLSRPLAYTPGSDFVYSDLGFILLGQIVEKVSGQRIEEFAKNNIFKPLAMESTFYKIPAELSARCAPTLKAREKCLPHDPISYTLTPAELGHAGLFSTAENLSHLIQMYLNNGKYKNVRLLKEETVKKMIKLPASKIHGLGFDMLSQYTVAPRGSIFPKGTSYGHTGYTGTSFWVDPASGSFLIFLTNRVLSGDELTAKSFFKLRGDVATAVGKQFYPHKFFFWRKQR